MYWRVHRWSQRSVQRNLTNLQMRPSRARRSLPFPFRFRIRFCRFLHAHLRQKSSRLFLTFLWREDPRCFNLKKLISNDADWITPIIFILECWLRSGASRYASGQPSPTRPCYRCSIFDYITLFVLPVTLPYHLLQFELSYFNSNFAKWDWIIREQSYVT